MANLKEPVTVNREWIPQTLQDMKAEYTTNGYIEPGILCSMAMRFYQERVRNDLILFTPPIVMGDYSYEYYRVAYRVNEGDYVCFFMYIDSCNLHDYGTGQVFGFVLEEEAKLREWLGEIMDRRSVYSARELINFFRNMNSDEKDYGIINKLEQWIKQVEQDYEQT